MKNETKNDDRTLAESYIEGQLQIMGKHGKKPHLDRQQYEKAVAETQRTFAALRPSQVITAGAGS
jgi:hypothetical protein